MSMKWKEVFINALASLSNFDLDSWFSTCNKKYEFREILIKTSDEKKARWRSFHFAKANVLFTNKFKTKKFTISLWFSFQFPSTCRRLLLEQYCVFHLLDSVSKHAHVSSGNNPRGLLHVFIRFVKVPEIKCWKIMQHLFLQTQNLRLNPRLDHHEPTITSEKIISHHILVLIFSKSLIFLW